MRITAIDPALRHIAWSTTDWTDPAAVEFCAFDVIECKEAKKLRGVKAAAATARWVPGALRLPPSDIYVVETQHVKKVEVDKADVRDLSMVTGAIIASIPTTENLLLAQTDGREQWSRMDKDVRHHRLRLVYLRGQVQKFEDELRARKVSVRKQGDLLDTVAMALWAAKGCPRQGV